MKENEKIWAIKDGYLVHRDGSIYALNWGNTGTMRKIKQRQRDDGYLDCHINGKSTLAHRFVAECFIPNPYNLPEINHKNEIKTDNRVENLEWCDRKYNVNYGTRSKKHSEKIKQYWESEERRKKHIEVCKTTCKIILQYTLDGEFIKEWTSLHEIQRVLGYDYCNILKCCKGKQKTAYDYIWRYK